MSVERTSGTDYRGEGLVLVIEDDRGVRQTACRILEFFGLVAVEDGQEEASTSSPAARMRSPW